MCYHQFLSQVESYERNGVLINAPCPYCEPKKHKLWKLEAEHSPPRKRGKRKGRAELTKVKP